MCMLRCCLKKVIVRQRLNCDWSFQLTADRSKRLRLPKHLRYLNGFAADLSRSSMAMNEGQVRLSVHCVLPDPSPTRCAGHPLWDGEKVRDGPHDDGVRVQVHLGYRSQTRADGVEEHSQRSKRSRS